MRKLILLSILGIYAISFSSWARKPAIEPQMEIINEFKPVPPNVAKGYGFTENVSRTPSAVPSSHQNTPITATTMFTLLILGIPLCIWGVIAWHSKKLVNNVVPLPTVDKPDDHDNWKQAS